MATNDHVNFPSDEIRFLVQQRTQELRGAVDDDRAVRVCQTHYGGKH